MSKFAELIGRLEKATGPDQELDARITAYLDLRPDWAKDDSQTLRAHESRLVKGAWYVQLGKNGPGIDFLPLTSSIDAALRLLPEWASYELTRSAAGEPTFTRCRLWDWRRGPLAIDADNEWKSEGNRPLPVNICISALKAREAQQ